jgi:steroid delta-isomerase-like uncharacterized protein
MPREQNITALKQAAERFKARDLDGHLKLYSNSVAHHGFPKRTRPGVAGLRDHYDSLLKGFPDMRVDTDDLLADGEKVLHRFHFSGTHEGEYLGFPGTGKPVRATGVQIHLFQQGQAVEVWQVMDVYTFLRDIGGVSRLRDMK